MAVVGEEAHQDHLAALIGASSRRDCPERVDLWDGELRVFLPDRPGGRLTDGMAGRYAPLLCEVGSVGLSMTCVASVERGKKKIEAFVFLRAVECAAAVLTHGASGPVKGRAARRRYHPRADGDARCVAGLGEPSPCPPPASPS